MLGTRGVPARHGGFETAAENIGRYLIEQGWRVIVYCQADGPGSITVDNWDGFERVIVPVRTSGPASTVEFDWKSARHAARTGDSCLLFGYNTAGVNVLQRLHGSPLVINMDGIEWQRERWSRSQRAFLLANERIARRIADDLIADHPEIERYLTRRTPAEKITMIPYGADAVTGAPTNPIRDLGLEPGNYFTLVCRPVPENSILQIVKGYSRRQRGTKLVVLGDYLPDEEPYHRAVLEAAGPEVVFAGAIFDHDLTQALRFHSVGYLHGHTVGGTNPSLVEAMAAGNPVIAHNNPYNRWVAGDAGLYFDTEDDVDLRIEQLLSSPDLRTALSRNSRERHAANFTWDLIGAAYERLLSKHLDLESVVVDDAHAEAAA
jgi:glycosyltransferase involved in cell wall biosynthesis